MQAIDIDIGQSRYEKWPLDVTCAAKRVDDLVYISMQLPLDDDDNLVGLGNVQEQARYALTRVQQCVEAAGGSIDDVVHVESYTKDSRTIPAVMEVAKEFFTNSKPTWTATATSGLYKKAAEVGFEALAVLNAETKDINPGLEWYAEPPWDVTVPCKVANDLVIMGQLAGVDARGEVVSPGDIQAQQRHIWATAEQCLDEAGGSLDNVADILWYDTDQRTQLLQFAQYRTARGQDPNAAPRMIENTAGTAISMRGLFRPDIAGQVRIIGVLGDIKKEPLGGWVFWNSWYPADQIPYAVKIGRYVFIAGSVMFTPEVFYDTVRLDQDIPGPRTQFRHCIEEYIKFLRTIGGERDNIVMLRPYTYSQFHQVFLETAQEYFHGQRVAWSSVGFAGSFLPHFMLELYGMCIVDEDGYETTLAAPHKP